MIPRDAGPELAFAMPTATVDSAQTISINGDTATVVVFGRRPNITGALAGLFGAAMVRALADSAPAPDIRDQISKAPLVTYADKVVLLREKAEWRVWLATRQRRSLDSISKLISDEYLDVPISIRAKGAATWLRRAALLPDGLIPTWERASMDTLVMAAQVADSIALALVVEEVGYSHYMRGTVTNHSGRSISELWARAYRATENSTVQVYSLRPNATESVFDMTGLNPGKPDSIAILSIEFR